MSQITLDHIDKIYINQNFPIKNLHALNYTADGLHSLAYTVRIEEINTLKKNVASMAMGFKNQDMLMNYFNWFSISAINYVRLIAFIDIVNKNDFTREQIVEVRNHKLIKEYCKEYIVKVIPEIYTYRNKLSAHYSLTDPFRDDNIATLESSVMNSVVYQNPYFKGGGLIWNSGGHSTRIEPWVLTKIYEDLCVRYWPNAKLPEIPEKD